MCFSFFLFFFFLVCFPPSYNNAERQTIDFGARNHLEGLIEIGKKAPIKEVKSISESSEEVSKSVFSLHAGGGTALGPALCISLGIISHFGGEIVVVTDGESTDGIGSGVNAKDGFSQVLLLFSSWLFVWLMMTCRLEKQQQIWE